MSIQFGAGRRSLSITALVLALGVSSLPHATAHDFTQGDIFVDHPWSRATPPTARVAAGYMIIRNSGGTADRLIAVESEISQRAEIHEMGVDANGVMTMRPLADGIEIPAGGEVALEPRSYHVMFMDLTEAPVEGNSFDGKLVFERAGEIAVEFAVEAMGASGGHHHGH